MTVYTDARTHTVPCKQPDDLTAARTHRPLELEGLPNMGNTCYLNALLQALRHCPKFLDALAETPDTDALSSKAEAVSLTAKPGPHVVPTCLLTEALMDVCGMTTKSSSASDNVYYNNNNNNNTVSRFIRAITRTFPAGFKPLRQNDVHEFFHLLLDRINHETGKVWVLDSGHYSKMQRKRIMSKGTSYEALCKKMDRDWNGYEGKNHSLIADVFCCRLVSQVKCSRCLACFHNGEVLTDIPVDMATNIHTSVKDCVMSFFQTETVFGWKCDRCSHTGNPQKCYRLWSFPSVLVVMLKRFGGWSNGGQFGNVRGSRHKNNDPVYLDAVLDLAQVSVGYDDGSIYELRAVIHHLGNSMSSGHYVSTCLCNDGKWRLFNDSRVSETENPSNRSSCDAYMMMYHKRRG